MITVKTNALKSALQSVIPAIDKRSPAMANAFLEVGSDGLEITGMSAGVAIRHSIDCVGDPGFSALLPVHLLPASLSGDETAIERNENGGIVFRCGRNRTTIKGEDTQNWSQIHWGGDPTVTLPSADLLRAIEHGGYAHSVVKVSNYSLTAILLHVTPDEMEVVSTDGKRLAIYGHSHECGTELDVLVPADITPHIKRCIESAGVETVSLTVEENMIAISAGPITLRAKTNDGTFVQYKDVIPNYSKSVALPDGFVRELRSAAQFTSEDSKAVNIRMDHEGIALTASSEIANGETQRFIEGTYPDFAFDCSPHFLAEAVEKAGECATLSFDAANKPLLITNGNGYTAIVMPIMASD